MSKRIKLELEEIKKVEICPPIVVKEEIPPPVEIKLYAYRNVLYVSQELGDVVRVRKYHKGGIRPPPKHEMLTCCQKEKYRQTLNNLRRERERTGKPLNNLAIGTIDPLKRLYTPMSTVLEGVTKREYESQIPSGTPVLVLIETPNPKKEKLSKDTQTEVQKE